MKEKLLANTGRHLADTPFKNIYNLTTEQMISLDEAEDLMETHDLSNAETKLLEMLKDDPECIPVLNNLGHLYGKLLSDFEKAVEYYEKVLELEFDNAWARDQRRRYRRYLTYD